MKEALVVTAFKKALMSRRSDAKGLIAGILTVAVSMPAINSEN